MTLDSNPLELFCTLYQKLQSATHNQNQVMGGILLDDENIELLLAAEAKGFFSGTVKKPNQARGVVSLEDFKSKLRNRHTEIVLSYEDLEVYEDWESFLASSKNRTELNGEFVILSEGNRLFKPGTEHKFYSRYVALLQVLSILHDAVDHSPLADHWVFSRRSKVEMQITFNAEQLEKADLDGHSLFVATMMDDEKHLDEKQSIIQEVLSKMLSSKSLSERFSWLLLNFKVFFIQFEYSYRMFACSFSFDKMRKEYEEKYREYSVKLNSALSDVSTKALAIPAAMIFSISKFEHDLTSTTAIWLNWLMVVGVIFISLLVSFLAVTHWSSLEAIKKEYGSLMKRLYLELPDDHSDDALSISNLLDLLDGRTTVIKWLLGTVIGVAIISSLIAMGYAACLH